jgi:hypothetical protein
VFRPSLRSVFLLLISLLALPPSAQGAVDVTDAKLTVTIARSSVVSDSFAVEFRVTGTDLNNGSITPPGLAAVPIALDPDGADLVYEKTYNSEAALNAVWPNGSYLLRVNGLNVEATLVYTRPLVTDPAISKPGAGSVVPPGPVEVLFTKCEACNQVGDSVVAVLENDANVVLTQDPPLTSSSEDWTPEAPLGTPLQLAEQSSFVTSVTSSALRQTNTATTGGVDDPPFVLFSNSFVQSDEIDFETGFDTPVGSFCLAANYSMPPAPAPAPVGCTTLTDPLLEVLDTSGMFVTQVDGHDVAYTVVVSDKGTITGTATADLDDNASQETGPVKGKLKGKDGEVKSKLSFSLESAAPPVKVKVKISDEYSIPGNSFVGTQTASGSINGVKLKDEDASGGPLLFPALGWLLQLDIDASGAVSNAVLTLENARSFPLSGTNKFKFSSGESSLKLESADKGIKLSLKKIVLNDSTSPMGVTGGDVSPRILGQKAKSTIP